MFIFFIQPSLLCHIISRISHFLLSCQYLVILLYYFLCVNFKYLKWTIRHDYCPGVYMVLVFLLKLTVFHKGWLFKKLIPNLLFSLSDLDLAVSGIKMPKKTYLQKYNRTSLFYYKLTNTHNRGITSRHKIAHDSCQWCEVMFFNSIFTSYDNSSSTIRYSLGNKKRRLTRE